MMTNKSAHQQQQALDAPFGKRAMIMAPWKTMEDAWVFNITEIGGGKVQYASVVRPKGNPFVRFSVFRVR